MYYWLLPINKMRRPGWTMSGSTDSIQKYVGPAAPSNH
jgi:hypothetical protein